MMKPASPPSARAAAQGPDAPRPKLSRRMLWLLPLLPLAACGKRGAPSPPGPPEKITYPRSYPAR